MIPRPESLRRFMSFFMRHLLLNRKCRTLPTQKFGHVAFYGSMITGVSARHVSWGTPPTRKSPTLPEIFYGQQFLEQVTPFIAARI